MRDIEKDYGEDEHMRTRSKVLTGAATAALLLGGVGAAAASGAADDDAAERAITGGALQKASEAALAHTGEGKVTGTEVGDEEGYYEVEVTLDNGTETDVHLDKSFNVTSTEADGAGEEGSGDD